MWIRVARIVVPAVVSSPGTEASARQPAVYLVDEGWSGQVEHRAVACVRDDEACDVAGTVVVPEIDLLRSQVGVSKRVARTGTTASCSGNTSSTGVAPT